LHYEHNQDRRLFLLGDWGSISTLQLSRIKPTIHTITLEVFPGYQATIPNDFEGMPVMAKPSIATEKRSRVSRSYLYAEKNTNFR
jgi:hypothetical protein